MTPFHVAMFCTFVLPVIVGLRWVARDWLDEQ